MIFNRNTLMSSWASVSPGICFTIASARLTFPFFNDNLAFSSLSCANFSRVARFNAFRARDTNDESEDIVLARVKFSIPLAHFLSLKSFKPRRYNISARLSLFTNTFLGNLFTGARVTIAPLPCGTRFTCLESTNTYNNTTKIPPLNIKIPINITIAKGDKPPESSSSCGAGASCAGRGTRNERGPDASSNNAKRAL
ncbi:MAG TPA: hypothetical protein DCE42_02295 [Myxococcales bacterium]|nr:hypothetical protein [Deltaproteobacteria bacterium]HAA53555.1 hypothetical protein [Myxococcales bacterium]